MTTLETPKNPETPEQEALEELRSEVMDPETGVQWVERVIKQKEYPSKTASSAEIAVLKRASIMWSDWKVWLEHLVNDILETTYNNSHGADYKALWKDFRYVAEIQTGLNILGRECNINGKYDSDTKKALKELISEYKNIQNVQFESDGTLPESFRNVVANALIYPEEEQPTEISNKSGINVKRKAILKKTERYPNEWKIGTTNIAPMKYPGYE